MKYCFFILIFTSLAISAQKTNYPLASIPDSLKINANSVVRLSETNIQILSQDNMIIRQKKAVTVLNEKGLSAIAFSEYYNKNITVKAVEAIIYDALGDEIRKIKRKDFIDQSAVDGFSIFSDNRILTLNYTPVAYPFTIVYTSEVQSPDTAFIPAWFLMDNWNEGIEKKTLTVSCIAGLGFRYKEFNFGSYAIRKEEKTGGLTLTAENILPLRNEAYAPYFIKQIPYVMMGLDSFHLEGVNGSAKNWKDLGQWYSDKLLAGTSDLPEATKTKIRQLVGEEKDALKKARIVYDYVQQKSRYISIQVGIGGWKPMLAADVDRLGYGDCKALTNYTRSLLEVVGVPSYYCVLYGGKSKRDIESDFVSLQGNHAILSIPDGKNYVWLECTSQEDPFGYQGKFTDDRLAMVVKPEGCEIVRTTVYKPLENTQLTKGNYSLQPDGSISGAAVIRSKGTQYENRQDVEKRPVAQIDKFYKDYFSHINNLKLKQTKFNNDKNAVEFTEDIALEAQQYGAVSGSKLIFAANVFNPYGNVPQRYRTRVHPIEIPRGFYDEDEITIALPEGFALEAKPDNAELSEPFGNYRTEYKIIDETHILYKRSLQINSGEYPGKDYEKYRKFIEQIAKNDNAKLVLVKK